MTSPSKDMVGIPSVGGGCMPDNLGESIVRSMETVLS